MLIRPTFLIFLFSISIVMEALSWGATGHRIVGEIASRHLNKKAKKRIDQVLDGQSLAMVSNYMDFIKSDNRYNSYRPWHYATIPDSLNYEQAGTPDEGDALMAIDLFTEEIRSGNYSKNEAFSLMCLVHLVGDIHQPLHVGNGKDKGGNAVEVKFFSKKTNLHRVWDSDMIDQLGLSYSEYALALDTVSKSTIEKWQQDKLIDWANESKKHRAQVYDFSDSGNLWYPYMYKNQALLDIRLCQAGIRLAGLLNELYD